MTGNDLVSAIRNRIADSNAINITDTAMLQNINSAIRYLSQILISRKAGCMTAEMPVIDYTQVPVGFHSFVGSPPLFLEGDVIRSYYGRRLVPMRYFRTRAPLEKLSDVIDFTDDYFDVLATAAATISLNKDEFDTTFEQGLINTIVSCLPGNAVVANEAGK